MKTIVSAVIALALLSMAAPVSALDAQTVFEQRERYSGGTSQ